MALALESRGKGLQSSVPTMIDVVELHPYFPIEEALNCFGTD